MMIIRRDVGHSDIVVKVNEVLGLQGQGKEKMVLRKERTSKRIRALDFEFYRKRTTLENCAPWSLYMILEIG